MKLSVVIITKDEEENIGRCLESIKWADEIIIVDAISQDKTVDVAKRYTDRIISHKWISFLDQRSFALRLAKCDFVLILDADEFLDDAAQDEIKKTLTSNEPRNGYFIMRVTYFLEKRLSFSERPDPIMRLFRREKGFVTNKPGQRGHEAYGVCGETRLLDGTIEHRTSGTIAERLRKINRYSTLWAEERVECGMRRPSAAKMLYAPLKSFIGNFFIKIGFLDGFYGFIWCILKALENFLKYAKLWERMKYAGIFYLF